MALPSSKIFLRSPYWITKYRAALDYIKVNLFVWNGDLTGDVPSEASIKLRANAYDGRASIDISNYARDLVEPYFSGTEVSNSVWVRYCITWVDKDGTTGSDACVTLTGLDGFSYFEDGVNYQHPYQVLLGQDRLVTNHGNNMSIPVLQDNLSWYKLQKRVPSTNFYNTFHSEFSITPTENTANVIRYINTSYGGEYADRVMIGFTTGVPTEYVYVDYVDCTRWGTTNVYFINRYGAVQRVDFFGRKGISIKTSSETYKRNILESNTYDSTRHQNTVLNKNGKISMTMNTGWYKEEDNDVFVEMTLSEQIWVRVSKDELGLGWLPKTSSSFIVPVNMSTMDFALKTRVSDKMINYTFEFEAASDRINSVR